MRRNIGPKIQTCGTWLDMIFWSERTGLCLFNSLWLTAFIWFPFFIYTRSISIEEPLHLQPMLQFFQSELLYQRSQNLSISQQNSLMLLHHFLKHQYSSKQYSTWTKLIKASFENLFFLSPNWLLKINIIDSNKLGMISQTNNFL